MRSEGVQRATAKPSARLRRGEIFLPHTKEMIWKQNSPTQYKISIKKHRPDAAQCAHPPVFFAQKTGVPIAGRR